MADEPPPRRTKPSKISANVERVQKDVEQVEKLREMSKGLLFFDHSSPSTRRVREVARQVFEEYCERKLDSTDLTPAEMWNIDTICERTWDLLLCMAVYAKGQIGDKPKAGVLFQQKVGMYWWIIRFIPNFTSIYQHWHNITTAAIHKAAIEFGFETRWRERNNITDAELELFYQQLFKFTTGLDNWKQHYVAWMLVYITSVRPGSFAVCWGYEAGASLGGTATRPIDECLRWSDIEFIRLEEGGILVEVTFHYLKGYRNPHDRKMKEGKRKFRLMPLNSDRHQFDLALLITALAYSRGLFDYKSPEDLFNGAERIIPKVPAVNGRPVFLASNQAGTLETEKAMHENALNPALQKMCERVGLFARNTMYSLRRTAITEVRRDEGTEVAQELAHHIPGGKSIYAYDDEGLADEDLVNLRMNLPKMNRADVRKMCSQMNTSRFVLPENLSRTTSIGEGEGKLQDYLDKEGTARARLDDEYLAVDRSVRDHLSTVADYLELSDAGLLRNVNDYRNQLIESSASDDIAKAHLATMEKLLADRKNKLRMLKEKYKREVKAELLKEAQKTQKVIETQARSNPLGTGGFFPATESALQRDVQQAVTAQGASFQNSVQALTTEADNEDQDADDAASDEDAADHGRVEPSQWENLPDEVTLDPGRTVTEGRATMSSRLAFFKTFTGLQTIPNTGLKCTACNLDDTVPYDKKNLTYTLAHLDKHLKSSFHTREAQIMRALKIDAGPGASRYTKVPCPLCKETFDSTKFLKHIDDEHNEFLE